MQFGKRVGNKDLILQVSSFSFFKLLKRCLINANFSPCTISQQLRDSYVHLKTHLRGEEPHAQMITDRF